MDTFKLLTQISFVDSATRPQTPPQTYDVLLILIMCLFILLIFALFTGAIVILRKKSFHRYNFFKGIYAIDNKINLLKYVTAAMIGIVVLFLVIAITINGKYAYAQDNFSKNNDFPQQIQAVVDSETGEVSIDDIVIENDLEYAMALFNFSTSQINYSNVINVYIDDNLVYNEVSGKEIKLTQAFHVDSGNSANVKFYFKPDTNLIGQVLNVEVSYYKASILNGSVQIENKNNVEPGKDVFVRYKTQDNSVYDYYTTYTDDNGDYILYGPFEALGWMSFSKDGYEDGYINNVIIDKPFMQIENIVLKVDNDDEYLTMTLHNPKDDYLTFSVFMPRKEYKPDLWTRVKQEDNSWSPWKDLSKTGYKDLNLKRNSVIQFKGINPFGWSISEDNLGMFRVQDSDYSLSGNIMSLIGPGAMEVPSFSFYLMFSHVEGWGDGDLLTIDKDLFAQCKYLNSYCFQEMFTFNSKLCLPNDFSLPAEVMAYGCYRNMFNACKTLTIPKNFVLPAKELADYCYNGMFARCEENVISDDFVLPANIMKPHCYQAMFLGNNNKIIPNTFRLNATVMADYCYDSMFAFNWHLELNEGFELPATSLAPNCYSEIFRGCSSISYLPQSLKLNANKLEDGCYTSFFKDCSSLKETIDLPATELSFECYLNFYDGCSQLEVKQGYTLPATILAPKCYASMFSGCISITNAPIIKAIYVNEEECFSHMFKNCKNIHCVDISCVTKFDPQTAKEWLLDAGTDGEEPIVNTVKCSAAISEKVKSTLPDNWDVVIV